MPKIKFIENNYIKPPYNSVEVAFKNYGDVREVSDAVADHLLTVHAEKFVAVDGYIPAQMQTEEIPANLIKIKFLHNPFLDSYHSVEVEFLKYGEIKAVPVDVASHLLSIHADKFELAEEVPEEKKAVGKQNNVGKEEDNEVEAVEEEKSDFAEDSLEWTILQLIAENPGITLRDLGEKLDRDGRGLVPTVNNLVKADAIEVEEIEEEGSSRPIKAYRIKV